MLDTSKQPQPIRREIDVDQPWLHLPVKNGAPVRRVRFVVNGRLVRAFDIELAEAEPDFWVFSDLSPFQGQQLTLEVDSRPPHCQGLAAIVQAGDVPEAEQMYREKYRPGFHYTPRRGWDNDPNGMVYYRGEYHFFYQHNPYGIKWGNMHWGHAASRDLVHWEELPEAIYPDELGTIFSGSAVVDRHNTAGFQQGEEKTLVAIYTAAGGKSPESEGRPSSQCLAYSTDCGRTWVKYDRNPVLPNVCGGNRDPRVFWHEPSSHWVMLLYLQKSEFGFFASPDLKQWTLLSRIDFPGLNEVPDIFALPVDGDPSHSKWVLLAGGGKFTPAANGRYFIGEFDGESFRAETGPHPLNLGLGCYSTQTFSDIPAEDGRRIQIAWMSRDFKKCGYPGMPFNSQFCFPCNLTLRTLPDGIRLCKQPVREIEMLHTKTHTWRDRQVTPGDDFCPEVEHDLLDVRADVDVSGDAEWDMVIRGNTINYNGTKRELSCFGTSAPLPVTGGRLKFQVLIDRTSIEIFADDGSFSMSGYYMPQENTLPLQLRMRRGIVKLNLFEIHELSSIW